MQMITSNKFSIAVQLKLSIYWGLIVGVIAGCGLAINNAWLENHYIQKGLTFVVLEVFLESLVFSSLTATGVLVLMIPGVAILGKIVSGWRNESLVRFAISIGGMALLGSGYWLNKSEWFPPAFTPQGMLANLLVVLLSLGLIISLYRLSIAVRLRLPLSNANLMGRFYHKWTFATLLVFFVGFNGY
ncbi:hypothetical protein MJD09_07470, partial [bacterium]|nr:hypothetical protein [bacterium]